MAERVLVVVDILVVMGLLGAVGAFEYGGVRVASRLRSKVGGIARLWFRVKGGIRVLLKNSCCD